MDQKKLYELLYQHLEECSQDTIAENLRQDSSYQESSRKEEALFQKLGTLSLTKSQRQVIEQWADAMQSSNTAYNAVIFRLGIRLGAALISELLAL